MSAELQVLDTNKQDIKEIIITSFIMNTEYILSNEFWDLIGKNDRARVRACLELAKRKLDQMDAIEDQVKRVLQEQ